MNSSYIIGDVHGCYKTLLALVSKLDLSIPIILCGDLIDRGRDSNKVVQWAIDNNIPCVMGNHESMMLQHFDGLRDDMWIDYNGGAQTLASYTGMFTGKGYIEVYKSKPTEELQRHLDWMEKLPLYLEYPDLKDVNGRHLFVSHAGVYTYADVTDFNDCRDRVAKNRDIYWHRDKLGDFPGIFQVVGHTPIPYAAEIDGHCAHIDTGAVYFNRKPAILGPKQEETYGRLTALKFPEKILIVQENVE